MKRFRFLSLVFLAVLLCAVLGSALADAPLGSAIARVDNPNPRDKLFPRSAPTTESTPLGLYYNGTEVHVLDAASIPDWAIVRIGALTGYMAKPFLAAGEAAQAVESMNPIVKVRATDGSGRLPLYEKPDWNAPILDRFVNGTGIAVLGVGPTWVHVFMDGQTGFMPVAGLSSVDEAA